MATLQAFTATVLVCVLVVLQGIGADRIADQQLFDLVDAYILYKDDTHRELGINYRQHHKRCHHCQLSVHGSNCTDPANYDFIPYELCRYEQNYCTVEKLLTNGEITLFSRGCAKTCSAGCRNAGTLLEHCRSCCIDNLCNKGNTASRQMSLFPAPVFLLLAVIFYV